MADNLILVELGGEQCSFVLLCSQPEPDSPEALLFLTFDSVFRAVHVLFYYFPQAGRSQDGRGLGQGDHFLPYKFIERTIEHRANFTKQLLIAS